MKQIPNNPQYMITKDGRVWSKRSKKWLKPWITRGYLCVDLGRYQHRHVHRLVLETYVGLRPDGMECRHLNGDPSDNRLENLKWGTKSENIRDSVKHGTWYAKGRYGNKHHSSKLSDRDRRLIIYQCSTGLFTQKELAAEYGVCESIISNLVNGKRWPFVKAIRTRLCSIVGGLKCEKCQTLK